MKKIYCFVACAFSKEEIDNLYENGIIPALDQLDIKGLKVDKLNHNEKIDQKIIDLINKSEFGISDLTYARPSVYFESGILEGQKKPVI
jgi:nucleoside 2-deoxyribosyltransferase